MDLSTTYIGLKLKHPIVPSSSPLSWNLDGIRQLEDAGASAIVMYSLFEEQLQLVNYQIDYYLSRGAENFARALSYFPKESHFNLTPDAYLDLLRRAKEQVEIPVVGSLNAAWVAGNREWLQYARGIEEAGADALEINIYFLPADPYMTGEEVEEMSLNVLRDITGAVTIPVAVKMSPYFSAIANMARRFAGAGAKGLVLFNRFYQPDFDLEAQRITPHLELSDSRDLRLPLRWVAILYGRIPVDFAITSGIHTHEDALKGLMAGARVTMMASELLQSGVQRIGEVLEAMQQWMEAHEYESIEQLQGSMSQRAIAEPVAFERAAYMKVLQSWDPEAFGLLPMNAQEKSPPRHYSRIEGGYDDEAKSPYPTGRNRT